jgi:hypothetical protein
MLNELTVPLLPLGCGDKLLDWVAMIRYSSLFMPFFFVEENVNDLIFWGWLSYEFICIAHAQPLVFLFC